MTNNYAYSVGRIRSLEPKLLDTTGRRRVLEASLSDLGPLLQELEILTEPIDASEAGAFEQALETGLKQTLDLLLAITPEMHLFAWLARRYDVNNLKILLKTREQDAESGEIPRLSSLGLEAAEHLREAVGSGRKEVLSKEIALVLEAGLALHEQISCPAAFDVGCDVCYWDGFRHAVERASDRWFRVWVSTHIDLANLRLALRSSDSVWPAELLETAVLEGGRIDAGILRELIGQPTDAILERLEGLEYGSALMEAGTRLREVQSYTVWETIEHDTLMSAFHDTLYESLSSGPLLAFWLMRLAEVRFLRTAALAKRCRLSTEWIEEFQIRTHV